MAVSRKSAGFQLLPPVPPLVRSQEAVAVAEWVRQAWEAQVVRLNAPSESRYVVLHAEPDKPRAGQVVYADGTDWDPGAGGGLYAYDGSNWVSQGGLSTEQVEDIVGVMLVNGVHTGIDITYDDVNSEIDISINVEYVQDLVGAMVSGNTETNITVTYDDTGGKLNFVVAAASTTVSGVVELATDAETQTGTDATRAVTPAGLRATLRERLLANRTYYVRTNGSDSNNGLANTAGGAFLTIQKAVNVAAGLDFNGFTVIIQVADGAYTAGALIPAMVGLGGGNLIIQGNTTTPANCTVTVAGGNCFHLQGGGKAIIYGFALSTTTSGWCLYSEAFSNLFFDFMRFGAAGSGHMAAVDGGKMQALGNYTITGNATYHWYCEALSIIRAAGITITLSGTRAFTVFANCSVGAIIYCFSNTFSGSATGQRYSATLNGIIHTLGGGATYLPGNSGGGVATQGQYV